VLAQSSDGQAAWAALLSSGRPDAACWLSELLHQTNHRGTQRDVDRDDSEPTGVPGTPQMVRSIDTPGYHKTHWGTTH